MHLAATRAGGSARGRRRRRPGCRALRRTSSTRIALAVTFSSVWLPATVVTAASSSSGLATASRRAIASSWPGSQSMITGVGMAHHLGALACSIAVMHIAALLLSAVIPRPRRPRRPAPRTRSPPARPPSPAPSNPGELATTDPSSTAPRRPTGSTTPRRPTPVRVTDPVAVRVALTGLDRTTPPTTTAWWPRTPTGVGLRALTARCRTSAPPRAPSISSRAATGVGPLSAGRSERASTRSELATTVRFEYGTTTAYGTATPEQAIGAGASSVTVTRGDRWSESEHALPVPRRGHERGGYHARARTARSRRSACRPES